MKRFSSFALSFFFLSSTTNIVFGQEKICYPLGGQTLCYDQTTSLASGCSYINDEGTEMKIDMCCPPGMFQGCVGDNLVSCDGDGPAMMIAITCGDSKPPIAYSSDSEDWLDVVETVADQVIDIVEEAINPSD